MKICRKKYYKITFTLASPLAIGDGSNYTTDRDVVRNGRGLPYIPASAVAGVSRSIFLDQKDLRDTYFGKVDINEKSDNKTKPEAWESRLIFYDANMVSDEGYHISVRDSVALDEYKTAIEGAKFDMEILEPGVVFTTYIEQNYYDGSEEDIAGRIADYWLAQKLHFGGKVMRGYGAIREVSVWEREFSLDKDGIDGYLSFDMYDDACWEDAQKVEYRDTVDDNMVVLRLHIKQKGGISIRRYTTRVPKKEEQFEPDSEQLLVRVGDREIPVIPGTSWAGAFKHRMKELMPGYDEVALFGCAGDKQKIRSRIRFGETQLNDATSKEMVRNAIDRFSGGATDQALFAERTYYGGDGELVIEVQKDRLTQDVTKVLAATICDLDLGFLAVGGLTAIGRGLFEVTQIAIDGEPLEYERQNMYSSIVRKLGGVQG